MPVELEKKVICECIREICFFRDVMGLKRQKFSWSLLAWHLYTRQLACESQTGSLAYFSVAVRNITKKRPVLSMEVLHPETCRLRLLLHLYARTNSAKCSWKFKQGTIWKHKIKLMTCHYKQAAREKISCI